MKFFYTSLVIIFCSLSLHAQHWQEAFSKAQQAFQNGDPATAATLATEALEIANLRHGQHSNQAINTLNLLVQSYQGQGQIKKAIGSSDLLLTALEKRVGRENKNYTQSVLSLGNLLLEDNQHDRALNLYTSNKAIMDDLYTLNDADYGFFLSDLAYLQLNNGDEAQAVMNYSKSIKILEQSGEDPYYILDNVRGLRKVLVKHQNYGDVVTYGRKFLTMSAALDVPVDDEVSNFMDLGDAYFHQKQYDSAEYFFARAKSYFDSGKIAKGETLSFIVNQLGYIKSVTGSYGESAEYLQQVASNMEDKTSLFNQAVIAQNDGRFADAGKFYSKLFVLENEQKLLEKEKIILYDNFSLYSAKINAFDKAVEYSLKAVKAGKELYGAEHQDYVMLLAHQALIEKSTGDYARAGEMYKSLIEKIKTLHMVSTSLYVDVLSQHALNMQSLNDLQQAKFICEEAIELAMDVSYKKDKLAVLYNNYAVILQLAGYYFAAEEYQVKALALVKETYGEGHVNYAYNLVNLGEIFIKQGSFGKADSIFNYSKYLIADAFGKASPEYAMVNISATKVDKELGRYAKADKSYLAALEILGNSGSTYRLEYAYALNDYGLLLKIFGNYKTAEQKIKEAATIFKQHLGETSTDYGSSLGNLANLYQLLDRDDEAEKYLKEVLKIDSAHYGRLHPRYATTLHNLASLHQKHGRVDAALKLYNEALHIDSVIHGTSHYKYASTLYNIADLYDTKGAYEKALQTYERVLQIMKSVYGVANPEYTYRLYGLARLHQRLKNNSKALELYRQISQAYLFQIREYFPVLSEDQKALFYAKISPIFNSFRELLLNMYRGDPSLAGEFFNLQLHTKAILLNASNRLRKEINESKDKEVVQLYDQIIQKKNRLLNYYNYSRAALNKQGIDLQKLDNELNMLEKQLAQKFELFSEVHTINQLSWRDVQSALNDDEVVVDIVRVVEAMNSNKIAYVALVLAKEFDRPKMITLEEGLELEEKAYNFYRNALTFEITDSTSYRHFWEPIHDLTRKYNAVYVSPDGIYNKINLNTLFVGKTQKYLIDDQVISFISSTKDFIKRNKNAGNGSQTAYLFGYPIFNVNEVEKVSSDAVNRLYEEWMTDIEMLPATKIEVNNIAATLTKHQWTISTNLELEASEANIKRLEGPKVLHIATHGYFSEDINFDVNAWKEQDKTEKYDFNPLLRSGLLLTRAESTVRQRLKGVAVNTQDDGILSAYEAMNLDLAGTDLVILSACETGLGEVKNGEGIYGLQRAFMISGAQNIMMSLWKVNDKVTQELMSKFYAYWLASDDLPGSLRKAQLEIKQEYANPLLWGGFILNGL